MSKDKNYGPLGFEATWKKQLKGFSEVKIFFTHDKSKTTIKYIDGNSLCGVEMYRSQYEIDHWLNHFQHYLDTGTFDTDAYWVTYSSILDENDKIQSTYSTEIHNVAMKLEKKLWSVHSPEFNKFMKDTRNGDQGIGFKRVPRP